MKSGIVDELREIGLGALSAIQIHDLELVDVEFVKEAGHWYLRYYIDKPGGINLDDCQIVSTEISQRLDLIDPIPQSYILEVSSPGIERPLKKEGDYLRFIGSNVEIKTYEALEGKKIFKGILRDCNNGVVVVEEGSLVKIPLLKISSAKLKFNWNGELK